MIPRTPPMARCLTAIRKLTIDGVPPSIAELRAELGYASKGTVCTLLQEMKARGLVDFERGRSRTLRIPEALITPSVAQAASDQALAHAAVIIRQEQVERELAGFQ